MKLYKRAALLMLVMMLGGCAAPGSSSSEMTPASLSEESTAVETSSGAAAEAGTLEGDSADPQENGIQADPGYTEDEPDDFHEILDICAAVAPGTAGSSLRQLRAAAELLDWEEDLADMLFDEGMKSLVAEWKTLRTEDDWQNLKASWNGVKASMEEIAADPAARSEALRDTGYTLGHTSYQADVREMVTSAITEALEK